MAETFSLVDEVHHHGRIVGSVRRWKLLLRKVKQHRFLVLLLMTVEQQRLLMLLLTMVKQQQLLIFLLTMVFSF